MSLKEENYGFRHLLEYPFSLKNLVFHAALKGPLSLSLSLLSISHPSLTSIKVRSFQRAPPKMTTHLLAKTPTPRSKKKRSGPISASAIQIRTSQRQPPYDLQVTSSCSKHQRCHATAISHTAVHSLPFLSDSKS